ncbi:hypothetical protein [Cellulomonas cellasea]|uniref:Uncharacterized protein n=1 Tax=Cellulomonas cellasea TaxID=43670 RepID=A0A7W4UI37_9CELL|nr:hypothetical protein [Cellulomonas cellasea]MBB2924110.1 hypothetical protein [Cellulomonas cellasea]
MDREERSGDVWAALARVHPDAGVFPRHRVDTFDQQLIVQIRVYLTVRARPVDSVAVVEAMARRFPRVGRRTVAARTRALLDQPGLFHRRDGAYRLLRSADHVRATGDLAARLGLGSTRDKALTALSQLPFRDGERAAHLREAAGDDGADLWTSWVNRLGTDAGTCHLWLTLEPSDPDQCRSIDLGILLLAGPQPTWFLYTAAGAQDHLVRALRARGWAAWMPHDKPGSPYREHLATERFLREDLNDVVVGVHARTPRAVWDELACVVTDVVGLPFDRVDASWAPLDEIEREQLEHARRVLVDAFTWVSERTEGSVNTGTGSKWADTGLHGTCFVCGRDLRAEESVTGQIGPHCRKKVKQRLFEATHLQVPWDNPDDLLERLAAARYRVPLEQWAYARPLTAERLLPATRTN